jgi:hypothetical protein
MVWRGDDLGHSTDWIRSLTSANADELDAAVRAVQRRGLTWPAMTREDFAIPNVDRALAEVSEALEHGRGIVLLRGIPVERYREDELRILYWGLGLHLGTPRYQKWPRRAHRRRPRRKPVIRAGARGERGEGGRPAHLAQQGALGRPTALSHRPGGRLAALPPIHSRLRS